jgi:hypothetical protein
MVGVWHAILHMDAQSPFTSPRSPSDDAGLDGLVHGAVPGMRREGQGHWPHVQVRVQQRALF